jgi:hypothetical protein
MREIKFRVWDKGVKTMLHSGFAIYPKGEVSFYWNSLPVNSANAILMQFTGLKDKNGNDIYEGDEVEYEWNDSWSGEWVSKGGVVEYSNGEFSPLPNNDAVREYVITGNIYQHPQLIEKSNQ